MVTLGTGPLYKYDCSLKDRGLGAVLDTLGVAAIQIHLSSKDMSLRIRPYCTLRSPSMFTTYIPFRDQYARRTVLEICKW